MNCELLQHHLLALEDPGRPPAEMRAHLARCGACRAWQRRLLDVERSVPRLRVPPSHGRDAFVARLRAGARATPPRAARREVVLRKIALATSLAAGLLMFVVGFGAWQWPTPPERPPAAPQAHAKPFLARLVDHDLDLARSADPGPRLESLTGLADVLRGQADPLAQAGADDDLGTLVRLYRRVLEDGVLHQAPAVKAAEREMAAERLAEGARRADELADRLADPCAAPVRDMAAAARKAGASLRGGAARARVRRAPWGFAAAARPLRRALLAPAAGALFAVAATPPAPAADDEARRFHRNRGLIERLVQDGLDLAREDNLVKRADRCNDIVQGLAREMTGAEAGESERVAELGRYLRDVLKRGVGDNLKTARTDIHAGSEEEKELQRVHDKTKDVVHDLKTRLHEGGNPPPSALDAIDQGWGAVDDALLARPAVR
jgi:hypothetical protein